MLLASYSLLTPISSNLLIIDYLPFLVALQPTIPINIMTSPKMIKSIVCVRLIAFKSELPAVPKIMTNPTETTH